MLPERLALKVRGIMMLAGMDSISVQTSIIMVKYYIVFSACLTGAVKLSGEVFD